MTHSPFDDPIAFERRWGRANPAELSARATADPLLFAADHISVAEREAGIVIVLAHWANRPPTMVVIGGAPAAPTPEDCFGFLGSVYLRLIDTTEHTALPMTKLGVVVHRDGGYHLNAVDRGWARALTELCDSAGIEPIGVMVRTRAGSIVRVPVPHREAEAS